MRTFEITVQDNGKEQGIMTFGSTRRVASTAAAVFLAMVGGLVAAAEQETLDSIVAIVNDDIVLVSEYEDRLGEWMLRLNESDRNDPVLVSAVREQVLEQLNFREHPASGGRNCVASKWTTKR